MGKFLQGVLFAALKYLWEENKDELYAWAKKWLNEQAEEFKGGIDDKIKQMMGAGLVMVGGALSQTAGKGATDLAHMVGDIIPGEVDDQFLDYAANTFNDFLKQMGR